jgi:hypothetical protein
LTHRSLTLLGAALMLVAVALVGSAIYTFLGVDTCIDQGGSFNYADGVCDFDNSHPYVPPNDIAQLGAAVLFGVAGSVVLVIARYRRKRAEDR